MGVTYDPSKKPVDKSKKAKDCRSCGNRTLNPVGHQSKWTCKIPELDCLSALAVEFCDSWVLRGSEAEVIADGVRPVDPSVVAAEKADLYIDGVDITAETLPASLCGSPRHQINDLRGRIIALESAVQSLTKEK